MTGTTMTSGSKPFGYNAYGLMALEPGETKAYPCETKAYPCETDRDATRVRKAAHNLNMRGTAYFTTRFKDDVLYVTRIR